MPLCAAYISLCFSGKVSSTAFHVKALQRLPSGLDWVRQSRNSSTCQVAFPIGERPAMEADKPSGPVATDSPVSSIANNPAGSSYSPPTIAATTATLPPPPPPPHPPVLHNAHPTVMDLDTSTAEDRSRRATSVISMDDLEAAQALEGLRSGLFTRLCSASAEKR